MSTGTIIGVDYSTYAAHLASIPLDGSIRRVRSHVATFRPARKSGEGEAILALGNVASEMADALGNVTSDLSSTVVWIERGFGMSRRADFILGAYLGAIYAACLHLPVAAVNVMEAREWKRIVTAGAGIGLTKKSTGNANAKKEVANEACRGLLALGEIDGTEWTADALDAFGIAYAGRKLNVDALA